MPPKKKTTRAFPDRATALRLYQAMLDIRLAEERVVAIYPSDKIQSPVHLSIGQEGIAAGVALGLDDGDHIYGTYRSHGLYLARGADMGRMFAELYGKDTGCTRGKGGSMHLYAPEVGLMGCSAIVGSTIPVAVGDALAAKTLKAGRVSAAVFGDGAVDEGVFFESVNFAVLKRLPVMFVCENNKYAIHSKVSDRHAQTVVARFAEGLGLRGVTIDGDDAFGVYAAVRREAAALRRGGAPVLIEMTTHRWHEHVGPGVDYHERYRFPREKDRAAASDPLARARAVLKRRFGLTDADFAKRAAAASAKVDAAVRFAEESPFPGPERLAADTFAPA